VLHLIHPALVHFGVTFLVVGALLEAYGLLAGHEGARRLGAPVLALGTVILVLLIASGYVAANSIELPDGAAIALDAHERSAWILLGGLVLLQFWKAWDKGRLTPLQARMYACCLLIAAAWVAYTAFLGGTLVYSHGVGVGQG
jgi:uncharacterized membrane protein